MHTIVTKETWSSDPNNAPLPSDFNRIESNTRKVEENRQEETDARITADSVEQSARESADTILQNNIDFAESKIASISTIDDIGSFAFIKTDVICGYGSSVNSSNLYFAGILPSGGILPISSPRPTGTWKCFGASIANGATLFVKES